MGDSNLSVPSWQKMLCAVLCPTLARKTKALESQVEMLTTYTSDTIYRLCYANMQYDYISPKVQQLLGYRPEELNNLKFRDLIEETKIVSDSLKSVHSFEPLEDTRKRGEVSKWQADYRLRRKDGKMIWVSDISYPWFDASGAIIGSVGCLRDITERVEAEQRNQNEIARMSMTDTLTGLLNRTQFFTRLEEEFRRLRRTHEDLALLIIDIDGLKKINADHSEKMGDRVIKSIADIIASCLRETDIGARVGGQEFAAILPDTPASGAYWVAERIRTKVSEHIIDIGDDDQLGGCTVSIGVSGMRFDQDMTADELYTMADNRLYIAKKTGRNRVSMDELADA